MSALEISFIIFYAYFLLLLFKNERSNATKQMSLLRAKEHSNNKISLACDNSQFVFHIQVSKVAQIKRLRRSRLCTWILHNLAVASVGLFFFLCVCVCVCERERESE